MAAIKMVEEPYARSEIQPTMVFIMADVYLIVKRAQSRCVLVASVADVEMLVADVDAGDEIAARYFRQFV